jgi:hypothetical protein
MSSKIESLDMLCVRKNGSRLQLMVLLTSITLSGATAAQTESAAPRQPAWGTSESAAKDQRFETAVGAVSAHGVFVGAQFGSGGVGLRNRGTGSIGISGVLTPVKAAFIYWAVITNGAAKAPDKTVRVQRLFPKPASAVVNVTGALLGTGPTPCWPQGTTISVFRGPVPMTVATGNGLYQVTLLPGAGGSTAGEDPYQGKVLPPLMEGASIVIVGTGTSTQRVALYDTGLAGKTFAGNPGLSYSLTLPAATTGTLTLFENIGADGQHGELSGYTGTGVDDESTVINTVAVAGPSSAYNDSDWNGSSALPGPQLWDDVPNNITAATPAGTRVLNVAIANKGEEEWDCLTPVANIVQEQ